MKTRISLALSVLAFTATTLAAQTPVTFKLEGQAILADAGATPQPTVSFGGNTYYSSPYSGAFELGTSGNFGSPFLVWCVDYLHESNFGDVYDAVVSPLTGNLSDTRDGNAGRNQYDWAAYLAGTMSLNWSISANRTHDVEVQEAMWYAVSGGAFTLSGTVLSNLGLSTGFYNNAAPTNSGNGWALIDGVSDTFDRNGAAEQEFLVYNPPGVPLEVTPEPATLSLMGTGLAGVIGMGLRRRKKRTA
jgi:hypothetical protein